MSLSLSAPTLTPEEEEKEIAAITTEEWDLISQDLYGVEEKKKEETGNSSSSRKPRRISNLEGARAAVDNEIRQIPPEDKTSYMEAMARCPSIVSLESNPISFLQSEGLQPANAAKRLVGYWKARQQLLGDQAFLPLTKDGAFKKHLNCLSSKVWQVLPEDNHGRAVMFYDEQRLEEKKLKKEDVLRCLWYGAHKILTRQPLQQQKDVVIIVDARSMYNVNSFHRKLEKKVVDLLSNILPLHIRAIHVCCTHHRSIMEFVCPMFKKMLKRRYRYRMVLHQADTTQETLASLEDYGFSPNSLPATLGGHLNGGSSSTTKTSNKSSAKDTASNTTTAIQHRSALAA
eukprot:CAMPEP_0116566978 /NCGR_PEP_ID=MMETSP0397-20121206/14751_1 /TAXON_ID=216820 /ORGANISM="Cyclophora tenuis, Strain ECT3854" /LENGTH=343 /DNA_ID=CAMNT_0004093917 /DNA_START=66 /DNA_END=1097 /DNA_ORIENTATION=+